jgi:hypothetical protein
VGINARLSDRSVMYPDRKAMKLTGLLHLTPHRGFAHTHQQVPAVAQRNEQQDDRDYPREVQSRSVGSSREKSPSDDRAHVPERAQAEPEDESVWRQRSRPASACRNKTRSYHGQTQHSCADELRADRCRILTNDHEQRDEEKEAEVRQGHASQAAHLDTG